MAEQSINIVPIVVEHPLQCKKTFTEGARVTFSGWCLATYLIEAFFPECIFAANNLP